MSPTAKPPLLFTLHRTTQQNTLKVSTIPYLAVSPAEVLEERLVDGALLGPVPLLLLLALLDHLAAQKGQVVGLHLLTHAGLVVGRLLVGSNNAYTR